MDENPNKVEVQNEEVMMERGKFTANGYTFTVQPVYLGEENLYLAEMQVSPVPNYDDKPIDELTDKELGEWVIALFSQTAAEQTKPNWFKRLFARLFHHNDYHYYNTNPVIQPLLKWIENKVSYNGQKVKFYELERKFGLNKVEIEQLFIYFHEISGFYWPHHQREK